MIWTGPDPRESEVITAEREEQADLRNHADRGQRPIAGYWRDDMPIRNEAEADER